MAIQNSSRLFVLLDERADAITGEWIRSVTQISRGRVTSAETQQEFRPIFSALVAGLRGGHTDVAEATFDELRALLAEYSRSRARQGFSPSETASAIFALKDAILSAVPPKDGLTTEFIALSKIIDDLGLLTFEAYSQARESVIAQQSQQLLELSTPVVKLWEGILALPLVGTLDSARTQVVMETLLQALVSTGSGHAIIDITGVAAVDTQVAQHLMKTIIAARLMGADCIVSGISPQIAQTIVSLGVEFGDIITKASLADALRLTLQRAGLEIRRTGQRP